MTDMSQLLEQIAAAKGMPAALLERSAEARAKATGMSKDDVLLEWAGDEGIDVGVSSGTEETPAAVAPAPGTPPGEEKAPEVSGAVAAPAEPPAPAPAASEAVPSGPIADPAALLSEIAAAKGMPAALLERSADARAKSTGMSKDDVLREWAADEGIAVGAPPEAGPAAAEEPVVEEPGVEEPGVEEPGVEEPGAEEPGVEEPAVEAAVPVPPETPPPSPPGGVTVEVIEPAATDAPDEEDAPGEEEQPVRSRYPVLLASMMVIIPMLAVLYVLAVPNGPSCGAAGQLAVDPVSGTAVDCDGSEYGVDAVNNFTAGEALFVANCVACHGPAGGGGAGPALSGGAVLATFPEAACETHIDWVSVGSAGWPDPSYGEQAKPVAGGMPGFVPRLTDDEVAQVVLYERVAFGGQDLVAAETDCVLVDPDEAT